VGKFDLKNLTECHISASDHFPVFTKLQIEQIPPASQHFTPFADHRHWLLSCWRSKIISTYNQPGRISWLSCLLTLPLFYFCLTTMFLLTISCSNAKPNPILGSFLRAASLQINCSSCWKPLEMHPLCS